MNNQTLVFRELICFRKIPRLRNIEKCIFPYLVCLHTFFYHPDVIENS